MRLTRAWLGGVVALVVALGGGCGDNAGTNSDAAVVDAASVVDAMVDATVPDAGAPDAPGPACDPLAAPGAEGCDMGEKCTWVTLTIDPEPFGELQCVPDGTLVDGAACVSSANGVPDDCQAGLICINGTCKAICGLDGNPDTMCAAGAACTKYSNVFANGSDDPIAGACNSSCNPITQLRADGTSCGVNQGCYLLTNSTESTAVCASAGSIAHGVVIAGTAYANSCLPGHQPRRRDPSSTTIECGALCQMVDVYSGTNEADEGGQSPYTCVSKGAAAPDNATDGESCRYWWAREPFSGLSMFSNTVGWCFKHTVWMFDSDGDLTPDTQFPRCVFLTTGDLVPPIDGGSDAEYFWCTMKSAPLLGGMSLKAAPTPKLLLDRLAP